MHGAINGKEEEEEPDHIKVLRFYEILTAFGLAKTGAAYRHRQGAKRLWRSLLRSESVAYLLRFADNDS